MTEDKRKAVCSVCPFPSFLLSVGALPGSPQKTLQSKRGKEGGEGGALIEKRQVHSPSMDTVCFENRILVIRSEMAADVFTGPYF